MMNLSSGLTAVLAIISILFLSWFFLCAILFRLRTPLQRLLIIELLINFLIIIFFSVYGNARCTMFFITVHFLFVGAWLPSLFIAINLVISVYFRIGNKDFARLQYFFYGSTICVPMLLGGVSSAYIKIPWDSNAECPLSDVAIFTNSLPFLIILITNIVCFILVVIRLSRNAKLMHSNTKQMIKFYSLLCFLVGFWRIPASIRFIQRAASSNLAEWSFILMIFFLSTEGVMKVIAFSCYFRLFQLFFKRAWRNKSETLFHEEILLNEEGTRRSSIASSPPDSDSPQATISKYLTPSDEDSKGKNSNSV